MNDYIPKPLDTSDVTIDKTLTDLIEKLAENTHEVWSYNRLKDGWSIGEQRDDKKKQHPCLVPYSDLSNSEKEYDRNTALETLKFVLKLGFSITPPECLSLNRREKANIQQQIEIFKNNLSSMSELFSLWNEHNRTIWQSYPEIYYLLGVRFLKSGEPLLAYDVFSEGLGLYSDSFSSYEQQSDLYVLLSQQQALALAETGAVYEAAEILKDLSQLTELNNSETLGLLGRTYKEMGLSDEINQSKSVQYLSKSFDFYFVAYNKALENKNQDDAYYNGINAATVSLLLGQVKQSHSISMQVAIICSKVIDEHKQNESEADYWVYATLGEAKLLMGELDSSKNDYKKAVDMIASDIRGQFSMYKQAQLILKSKNLSEHEFDDVFKLPTIAVFSGHMIDSPDTACERFPESAEGFVRQEIQKKLNEFNSCIAYSSAANGADIIFIEEVLTRGGEVNIILPFDIESFKKQSVETVSNDKWCKRFDKIINQASRIIILSQFNPDVASVNYEFTNQFIYGLAKARSKMTKSKLECISIWDEKKNNKLGGTSRVIDLWLRNNQCVNYVHPKNGLRSVTKKAESNDCSPIEYKYNRAGEKISYYNYLPLLFADVKGYSKLNEIQLVSFSTFFLKILNHIFNKHSKGILNKRTQGDGMFVVFNSLQTAADFAMDVNLTVNETQWQNYDLPDDLKIRISLDAGPCYSYIEPITETLEFCGDYVNRAARMEPITPPGHIFASETFVALANTDDFENYKFTYTGQVVLPKGHGIIPAYHMYRK